MILRFFKPLSGIWENKTKQFLADLGLRLADGLDFTVLAIEGERMIATGSRQGSVIKCLGVVPDYQGGGLAAAIMTELVKEAHEEGIYHLFVYTSPQNIVLLRSLGFYEIALTNRVALLENRRDGIRNFIESERSSDANGHISCIVANCNPFTNGHLYLADYAARHSDFVYFFVLSEDKSLFSADMRLSLARENLRHLPNVHVCPTGGYLVSSATFPDYFLKENIDPEQVYYDLDITVFGKFFTQMLGIHTRFVGTEPVDAVTKGYNEQMKLLLPQYGVTLKEIPRYTVGNTVVSASTVRRLMCERQLNKIKELVPCATYFEIERRYDEKSER